KVALVTMDTYRIAAVDQLKTYAEIIGVPLEVVFNPDGLKSSLKKLASHDIIFIDTAGRSPKNEEHMQELADFLEVANPDEVILVLSAATRTEDLLEAYKRFKVNRVDKIIFTKLDETNCYGQILSVVYRTKSHISYITNGQNVPDDIEVPDELELAAMILGEEGRL
ncbi:MAG: flagellar biosynthesis protein FlhF, partial [Candidatus Saccharibacteria bacterium]